MNPNADHIKHLTPARRQRLEHFLKQFEQGWSTTAMSVTMSTSVNLPEDHPLRYPLLIEMTKVDLKRRWKMGKPMTLEKYLESYPELGSVHNVSVDLLRAEYDARKDHGDRVEIGEYARRFPNQYPAFQRLFKTAPAAAVPDLGALQTQEGELPGTLPPPPRPMRTKGRNDAARPRAAAATATGAPKRRSGWRWFAAVVFLLLAAFLGWMGYKGGFSDPKKFVTELVGDPKPGNKPDGPDGPTLQNAAALQSLTVKLDLGAGADLQEPIALDLGLGFPLWLMPAGPQPPTLAFGAVPQSTTARGKVPAGGNATFTFLTAGEPGQDVLTTTPQLLAHVKVGDIRRVGFTGLAQEDWELAGYEIQVNGKTLHSASGLKVRPKQLQDEAMKKLAANSQTGSPVDQERADLRDLVQSGLASDNEKARFAELEKQAPAGPSPEEKMLLERQLHGQAPWYVEKVHVASAAVASAAPSRDLLDLDLDFLTPRALAAAEAISAPPPPRSVRVTVVTDASLDQSDSKNYVYFIVGNRKYMIGSPESPLTSHNGPQTFELDLTAGPLESADLHGYGLGMLAPPKPQGKGPDRWHPRRVLVEVDGKTVYDSESVPTDLKTLEAIRLVPPSQLDLDGVTVVKNPSNSRELYVWTAGVASGFDTRTGSLNPLPSGTRTKNGEMLDGIVGPDGIVKKPIKPLDLNDPEDLKKLLDPNTPIDPRTPIISSKASEPSSPVGPNNHDPNHPFGPPQDSTNIGNAPRVPQGPGGFPNGAFPGEMPRLNPVNPFNPVTPAPTQVNVNINFNQPTQSIAAPLPPESTKPVNKPKAPVIESVEFVKLSKGPLGSCLIALSWKIADESGVDHYEIVLQGMEDDLSMLAQTPRNGRPLTLNLGPRSKGIHSLTASVPEGFILDYRFVVPIVTPVPIDASVNAASKLGPARSTASLQPFFINASFPGLQQLQPLPLAVTAPSGFRIHTGFDVFEPNGSSVVPLDELKPPATLSLTCNDLQVNAAPTMIRFYTGFSGGEAKGNKMEYRVTAFANEIPASSTVATTTIPLNKVSVLGKTADPTTGFFTLKGGDFAMDAVSIDMSALTSKIQAGPRRWSIELTVTMRKFSGDPSNPPGVADAVKPIVFDAVIMKKP